MTQYQLDNTISAEQRAEFDQLLAQIIEEWAGELKNCPQLCFQSRKSPARNARKPADFFD